jgi:hypothetical protein
MVAGIARSLGQFHPWHIVSLPPCRIGDAGVACPNQRGEGRIHGGKKRRTRGRSDFFSLKVAEEKSEIENSQAEPTKKTKLEQNFMPELDHS